MQTLMPTIRPTMLVPGIGGFTIGSRLWDVAGFRPSLDLQLATTKSLVDASTGSNLVTFTRASSATFTGSDGLIRPAVTNLLLRSEEFDNASWTKTNSTVTADDAISPDGTIDADKIVSNSGSLGFIVQSGSQTTGTSYTWSVFAKAGEYSFCQLRITGTVVPSITRAYFNLATGTITGITNCTASITPAGDGWYRCSITYTTTSTAVAAPRFYGQVDAADTVGDGTSGIYLWGAQLEQSSSVGEYIPTTSTINSAPRFDHNPETGESLGLLVEEARTNLLLRSEEFDDAEWAKNNATVTANVAVSPNGTTTADKVASTLSAIDGNVLVVPTLLNSTPYTGSVYAKADAWGWVAIEIRSTASNILRAWFNVSSGVVGTVQSGMTATIQAVGNGWYRCAATRTSGTTNTDTRFRIFPTNADNVFSTGDGTSGLFLWGAQLETGAFPTSYIPTTTATVTRSADVASISGSNFSAWYRQDEGTSLIEFKDPDRTTTRTPRSFSDGTSTNRWDAFNSGAATINNRVVIANVSNNPGTGTLLTGGALNRHVLAVGSPNAASAVNGTLSTASTSSLVPTVDRLIVGADSVGSTPLTGTIRRLTYWPQRLPNSTLQAVTQ
jgi:hypothetical protein